jgi:hypothetical protein
MRLKLLCLSVVSCATAILIAACAGSNVFPTAVSSGGDDFATIHLAKVTATGAQVETDTIPLSANVIFSATVVRASLLDSMIMPAHWSFGEGSPWNCSQAGAICSTIHKYSATGTYTCSLTVVLTGNIVRTVWKKVFVVPDNQVPSVVAAQESLFVFLGSTNAGSYNRWNLRFGVGVNSLAATALNAGVAVYPYYEGGSDSLWGVVPRATALTQKTADGKYWIVALNNVKDSTYNTIRIGIDLTTGRFLWQKEIINNPFDDPLQEIFGYSLKVDGTAVPKTTNYGTRGVLPVDTTHNSLFPAGTYGDTTPFWLLKVYPNPTHDSATFYFNYKLLGCHTDSAWVTSNLTPARRAPTMISSDTVGAITVAYKDFPSNKLVLQNFYRGACIISSFSGSRFADSTGNAVFISANVGALSKRAK